MSERGPMHYLRYDGTIPCGAARPLRSAPEGSKTTCVPCLHWMGADAAEIRDLITASRARRQKHLASHAPRDLCASLLVRRPDLADFDALGMWLAEGARAS